MSEEKEPTIITIEEIKGNFYGGFPYRADWQFNTSDSPSTLSVSVVNSEGIYSISDEDIGYKTTSLVELGGFKFNGYLVSYEIEENPVQKVLTLKYIDKSVDLDRYCIGLYGKHGGISGPIPPNMFILGREYGPCDKNLNPLERAANINKSSVDRCDPCPNMPANGYANACEDPALALKLNPVYYTFNDLLGILGKITSVNTAGMGGLSADNTYLDKISGTVRSVLSSWCQLLGKSYYYDPVRQELVIVNRGAPLQIPSKETLSQLGRVMSLKYGKTMENTFSRGYIGTLETNGSITDFSCQREDTITLYSLTLSDLITENSGFGASIGSVNLDPQKGGDYDKYHKYIPPPPAQKGNSKIKKYDPITLLNLTTVAAYYGDKVRMSVIWFGHMQILNAKKAKDCIGKETISEWGNMNILKVITMKDDKIDFERINNLISDKSSITGTVPSNEDEPNYYFFIAQWNEEVANRQEARDIERAKNFLGKFFYRAYDSVVSGSTNGSRAISIDAAGEDCTYHARGKNLKSLRIFSFGHTGKSTIGQLTQILGADDNDNIESIGQYTGRDFAGKYRSLKSFLLLDRGDNARFRPHENNLQDWQSTLDWYASIAPKRLVVAGMSDPDILVKLWPDAEQDSSIHLFVAREIDSFDISISANVPHPDEPSSPKTRRESYEQANGFEGTRTAPANGNYNAAYGLMSPATVQIGFPALTVFPPAQSISPEIAKAAKAAANNGLGDAGFFSEGYNGFRVFVQASTPYQKVMPRIQKTAYVGTANNNVAKVDYIYRPVDIQNMEATVGRVGCIPSDAEFRSYMSRFAPYMAVSNTEPGATANLRLLGVMPNSFDVASGLSSITITVGDQGVYSDYKFEDKVVIPPSEDVIQNTLIRQQTDQLIAGYKSKMTDRQYMDVQMAVSSVARSNRTIQI